MSASCNAYPEKPRDIQSFNEKRSQLTNQFLSQQKEVWGIFRLHNDVTDSKNISTHLHAYNTDISKSYNRDATHFRSNIDKLNHRLRLLQHKAREVQPTTESVSRIKVLMQEIETCVETIRSSQRSDFDELQYEEQRLWQEILSHQRRFEIWEKRKFACKIQANFDQKTVKSSLAENEKGGEDVVHVDIRKFQELVLHMGGHTGGWDEVDHATFLKHRARVKDGQSIGECLLPFIPVHSLEAIDKHEQWYRLYCELSQKSRDAINKWKENKAKLKAEQSAKSQLKVETPERDEMREREEARKRQEMEDKHSQLTEWRLEKERVSAKRRVEDREREELRRLEIEREQSLKEKVKLQVAEYVCKRREAEREVENVQIAEREMERQRGLLANTEVIKFLARDREIFEKLKEREEVALQKELEREERLEKLRNKVRVEGCSDPERAIGKTEGWKVRERACEEERARVVPSRDGSVSAPIMKLGAQRLSTPSWRQNL